MAAHASLGTEADQGPHPMSRRETAAQRDERIVRKAGPWRPSPMVGLFLTTAPEDIPHGYNDVLEAAARILNRLAKGKKGKR